MSTIIKAGQSGPLLKRLRTVDLADHLAEAKAVIAEAKRHAARIVLDAQRQSEQTLAEAKESGHRAGYESGYAEGTKAGNDSAYKDSIEQFNQRHVDVVAAMQKAVSDIDEMKEDLRISAQKDLLDFAVATASKLTFAIGQLHRESAQANLRRALDLVDSKTDLVIQVNPRDVASIETFADSVSKVVGASRALTIVEDDSIAPGGCKVERWLTEIDATLETQVSEMVSLLVGDGSRDD
jgi:flagellar assembly protein FliH